MSQSPQCESKIPVKLPQSAIDNIERLIVGFVEAKGYGSVNIEIHFKEGKLGGVTVSQRRSFVDEKK